MKVTTLDNRNNLLMIGARTLASSHAVNYRPSYTSLAPCITSKTTLENKGW
jgi:hypothetical protein